MTPVREEVGTEIRRDMHRQDARAECPRESGITPVTSLMTAKKPAEPGKKAEKAAAAA